jgi:hypothetical protein
MTLPISTGSAVRPRGDWRVETLRRFRVSDECATCRPVIVARQLLTNRGQMGVSKRQLPPRPTMTRVFTRHPTCRRTDTTPDYTHRPRHRPTRALVHRRMTAYGDESGTSPRDDHGAATRFGLAALGRHQRRAGHVAARPRARETGRARNAHGGRAGTPPSHGSGSHAVPYVGEDRSRSQ